MTFKRYPRHRKKRLGDAWRRPKGWQNKLRLEKKGHGKRVKIGYRTKADERHTKNGLEVVTVYNVDDVKALDAKQQGAVVGNIGMRKRIAVLKAIREEGVTLHTGDVASELNRIESAFKSRKQSREEREKERKAKQEELEKKAEEAEEKESASDLEESAEEAVEEAKEKEKKEKDKVLSKAR